ncbi:FMN-dependent NADH-azoreductase [Rhizobium bangladeshense]|uniref:FMN-dependent NADH-azoreductase n=1 Tax=Rhizobium bangladeshense TaxID=1138189 RepID=UPI000A904AFA|nr:NAD(P)H-dependent oxidoreductase [Rhizobium bangladeshense]
MKILHIDGSPRQESHSRKLSAEIVDKLREVGPGASITRRDLGLEPLPHTLADYAVTLSSPSTLAAPLKGALDLSEALIQEVEAADVIVIGTPMYNYTVPPRIKAWIDQILRVNRTMKSAPAGKVGMLQDRPVFIGVASGGVFAGERANQPDFLTPYLSLALSSRATDPAIPFHTGHGVPRTRTSRIREGQSARSDRSDGRERVPRSVAPGSAHGCATSSLRTPAP